MRTFIKTTLWLLGILVIIYVTVTFLLVRLVSPTVLSTLEDKLSNKLNAPAKITATIHWHFFPQPAVTLSNATVELGTNHVRSTIKKAHVSLKFKPLLSRKIVPAELELKNANIDLTNIKRTTTQKSKSLSQTEVKSTSKSNIKPAQALSPINLPRMILSNSQFKWQNQRTKRIVNLSSVNLSITSHSKTTDIKGAFTLSYDKKVHQLKLNTRVKQGNPGDIYFSPFKLGVVSHSHNKQSSIDLSTNMRMNLSTRQVKLASIKGQFNGVPFKGKAQTSWQTQNKQLTSQSNLILAIAGGQLLIGLNYQSPAQRAKIAINAKSVDLSTVSHALQLDNAMKGTASIRSTLETHQQNHQWIPQLNGTGHFQLNNVQFGKTDFGSLVDEGIKHFNKKSSSTQHGITTFSAITGTFNIHDGVFYNDDLKLEAKNNQLSGKGNGHINLVTMQINYTLTLLLAKLNNFALPLEIKGPIEHPKIKPDFNALGKNLLKDAIKKHSFKSLFHDKKLKIPSLF